MRAPLHHHHNPALEPADDQAPAVAHDGGAWPVRQFRVRNRDRAFHTISKGAKP